jgi:hypothetical protein
MKKIILLFALIILTSPILAQEREHEVNSEVPELTAYHDVIYQLWHTAWPNKDMALFKSLLPDIEKGFESIKKAELPGILRDKKAKWDEGLKKLESTISDYKAAIIADDSEKIMSSAEKLHAQYEGLVRTVKPVLKEVDEFHQVLYNLYHYYNPNFDYDKIKEAAAQLKEKMTPLMAAKLSERRKPKEPAFDKARKELLTAVDKLIEVVNTGKNKEAINNSVDGVHSKYQELEKVFD